MPRGSLPLKTRGIAHSTLIRILSSRRSILSGCLTAAILSGQRSILSGCLTSAILSDRHSTSSGYLTSGSGRRSTFSGYFTSGACAEWERRAIQLPRSGMSRYSDSAYPENIRSRHFRFLGQLSSLDTRDSPDPFPPTIKRQTPIILTTKSPELSLIFNSRSIGLWWGPNISEFIIDWLFD